MRNPKITNDNKYSNLRQHTLLASTLYVLITLPISDASHAPWAGLLALLLALSDGGWRRVMSSHRTVIYLTAGLIVFSLLTSELPDKTLTGSYNYLRGMLLLPPALLLADRADSRQHAQWLLGLSMIAVTILIWLTIYLYDEARFSNALYDYCNNILDENPHNLINSVAITLLCLIAVTIHAHQKAMRFTALAASIFILWLLVYLRSEGTWLALGITLFALLMLYIRRKWFFATATMLILIIASSQLVFIFPDWFHEHTSVHLGGFQTRAQIYTATLQSWLESPWTGHGINTFKYLGIGQIPGIETPFIHPHEIYLEILVSVGILGSALLALITYKLLRHVRLEAVRSTPLAMTGYLVTIYLAGKGLTDMKFFSLYPIGLFFLGLGFMSSRITPRAR